MLVDVHLPDGTGWDLVDRVRTSVPGGMRVPVVAITGSDGEAVAPAARARGVRHVVTKPIEPAELAAALTECLDVATCA
jgi:CheY-like chemotaxis protein